MKSTLLMFFALLFASFAFGQSVICGDSIISRIQGQLMRFPQEKIYLHTDKQSYMVGDTLWFRAHLVDAQSHLRVTDSKYVYVELRSHAKPSSADQIVEPSRVRIIERDGIYAGYLPLPMTINRGDYTLSAYTNFMRNQGSDYLFRKSISIGDYGDKIDESARPQSGKLSFDVQFFAEGGYLVSGSSCCVGFKAMRPDGTSIQIRGVVRDNTGEQVASFSSQHAGMGKFFFTPKSGHNYTAICTDSANNGRSFRLPSPSPMACVLRVFTSSSRFAVDFVATEGYNTSDLSLLVHSRGKLCHYSQWEGRHKTFVRSDLPDGVLQLLLLDGRGATLSERLVFNYNAENQNTITINADKSNYVRREKISINAKLQDANGKPLSGSFSVAVTDNRMVNSYRRSDIRTSLLLESDLRGYIENPAYYFDSSSAEYLAQIDALMLTQGWRRYDVPKLIQGQYTDPSEPLEIGQQISGRIRKTGIWRKRNFKDYTIGMVSPTSRVMATALVDSSGRFELNGFDLADDSTCVVRASGLDDREDVELIIDPERYPDTKILVPPPSKAEFRELFNQYVADFTDAQKNVLLEEVVISAKAKALPTTAHENLAYTSFDDKEINKEKYGSLEQALRSKHGISFLMAVY